jgi:glycosyltransferase involved in cell wall biosynthesis
MRAHLQLRGLAAAGRVPLVVAPVFGRPAPPARDVRRLAARIDVLELAGAGPVADLAARLATPAGRGRAEATHPLPALCEPLTVAAAERLAALGAGTRLVHVMRAYLAPLLDALLDAPTRPLVSLDVDDVESDTQAALGHAEEAARFARLEAYYLPLVDAVSVCSSADAALLGRRHALRDVAVVPNAVRLPRDAAAPPAGAGLVLVGTLAYAPNADAASWICREVLPLLPGVPLAIVGSRPPEAVRALAADPRVEVAADVRDLRAWYANAAVAIAPAAAGGGTRIKVLEAFAHARPVVATSAGARGLDLDGAVVVADAPAAFAAACRRLLDDPAAAATLAARGREAVRRRYAVEVVSRSIADRASRMLARCPTAPGGATAST